MTDKIDLMHGFISVFCPACGEGWVRRRVCELEAHPQIVCPECDCQYYRR